MALGGTRVLDQDLDLGGVRVHNPRAPVASTDVVRLQDLTPYADASGWYVVVKSANAPANAVNLGAMGSGLVRSTVAGAVATLSIDSTVYLSTTLAASTYQPLLTSASGANLTGKLVLGGVADAGAPNAQFLGALTTGLVKVTTTTGVLSTAVETTDFPSASAYYLVTRATSAPTNATSLGGLAGGVLQHTVSGAVSTPAAFSVTTGLVPYGAAGVLTTDATFRTAQDSLYQPGARSLKLGPSPSPYSSGLGLINLESSTFAPFIRIGTTGATNTAFTPNLFLTNDQGFSAPSGNIFQTLSIASVPNALYVATNLVGGGSARGEIHFASLINGGTTVEIAVAKPDGGWFWYNSSAAVSPSGTAGVRSNAGKLQYSENTGAWANFTDIGANSAAYYVVTRSTSAPTNSTNLGALSTGLVKSTVSGAISTLSIDTTAYLSGSVGPGAGTYGAGGNFVQSVTLDANGRVTAVAVASPAAAGADALGYYIVARSTNAPANAVNLGALSSGLVRISVTGAVATLSSDTTTYLSQAYSTVAAAGAARTQRSTLNFAANLTAVDNAGATRTDVDLATTTVTAGSYTHLSATIDAYGRITAASSGAAGADPLGYYLVGRSTNAPTNAINLGGLASGLVRISVSGAIATVTSDTSTYLTAAVTSAVAGTGIGVSSATGAVTFTNTGVTSIVAGTNVTISGATGAVTINAATSGTGADAAGWYVVTKATNAPANAINLGGMGSGLVRSTVAGAVATLSIDTSTYLTAAYTAVQQAGAAVTARSTLNFTAQFAASDVSSKTQIDLASGVIASPGTYGHATIVVDTYGRVVSATANAAGADASSYYVVTRSTSAPANATNLGALSSGFVKSTVSGAISTLSIDPSTYLTTTAAASTYQPIVNFTEGCVVFGASSPSGSVLGAVTQHYWDNTNKRLIIGKTSPASAVGEPLTLSSSLTTGPASSWGSTILFDKAADQGITKTGGELYVATIGVHGIDFITNSTVRGSIGAAGTLTWDGDIIPGVDYGSNLGDSTHHFEEIYGRFIYANGAAGLQLVSDNGLVVISNSGYVHLSAATDVVISGTTSVTLNSATISIAATGNIFLTPGTGAAIYWGKVQLPASIPLNLGNTGPIILGAGTGFPIGFLEVYLPGIGPGLVPAW